MMSLDVYLTEPMTLDSRPELEDLRRRAAMALAALNEIDPAMISFPAAALLARAVALLADEEPAKDFEGE